MSVESGPLESAICLLCKDGCSGLQPHSWRKACVACGCGIADHAHGDHGDDDRRMGRLLADTPSAHLTAKVKGGGGLRLYKRNRMIVTYPVVSRKDPTFSTVTYDWAPAGLNQKLAKQYMELIPEIQRPVSGTGGAALRRRRLLVQLPVYDRDPLACRSLAGEDEISAMLLFVKHYKTEALGVGEVALPADGRALADGEGGIVDGEENNPQYRCSGCGGEASAEDPAVFAQRAGYADAMWHPACFVCADCGQGLVDLVYFWTDGKLLCGRHYCQSVWPRCCGCDELIFSDSFHTQDGHAWHHQHYCCWKCGQSLDTPCHH
ncbi:LIM and cysteine-rich domains protein 1 [Corythoichthys intestinalis]|uniref:LIM and cysteine-rich domains protein 1 n=1 Tax=Corythoichthys intestinalis TaxID=161448 RepID=UPI0025A630D1|nr:LIM and cysteine-rich domains protein 1 [Corythoichthys intestinalis]XP_061814246.1 LIM and cysteine-rich domains protein 1-like [Nerophis lumbriciformis]